MLDEDGFGADPVPDNVIPFPALRVNAKLSETWTTEMTAQNGRLSTKDDFTSPIRCLDQIIRRRTLPTFPWPSAWPELARRCRAYAGDCIIVTGPTGAGKTSWAIQVALSSTGNGIPILWCALELDPTQITERIVANMHGVHTMAVKEHWTKERIAHSLAAVDDLWRFVPRVMDPEQQLAMLRRAIALVWRVYRVKPVVVIDYLGKLAAMARDIRQATMQAAESLRATAVEDECFVLMLAQPSRAKNQALTGKVEHESATDTSGSAAESGEAENASAIEINLEVFKANDAEVLEARWHVAKSRHCGGEGTVGARFSKPGGQWTELDYVPTHPIEIKAKVERDKKDKHRTAPAPTPLEARSELNALRSSDADTMRRLALLDAIRRHGALGMDQKEMRNVRGAGRSPAMHRALQDLERSADIERCPSGRWRVVPR